MGYTSYYSVSNWTSKDTEGYEKALPILKKIAEKYMSIIQYECDDDREPQVDYRGIHLNGRGEDGHETFAFKIREVSREFCKTARKPYDLPVCEMLLVLKAHLPNFELSSDGFSGYAAEPKIDGFWGAAIENVKEYGIHYQTKIESQGKDREQYVNITPIFDKFVNAVAAGMKPAKKAKWEYSKIPKSGALNGWREDIKKQLREIGLENIRKIKSRNAGYVNEESYAMLVNGEQVKLGAK